MLQEDRRSHSSLEMEEFTWGSLSLFPDGDDIIFTLRNRSYADVF